MMNLLCCSAMVLAASSSGPASDWSRPILPDSAQDGEVQDRSSVRLSSDGQSLHFEIDLLDATPASRPDPIHSDHVELWLGLEDLAQIAPTELVSTRGGTAPLFLAGGKADPRQVSLFLEDEPESGDDLRLEPASRP